MGYIWRLNDKYIIKYTNGENHYEYDLKSVGCELYPFSIKRTIMRL